LVPEWVLVPYGYLCPMYIYLDRNPGFIKIPDAAPGLLHSGTGFKNRQYKTECTSEITVALLPLIRRSR